MHTLTPSFKNSRTGKAALGLTCLALLGLGMARSASAQTIGNAGFETPGIGNGSGAYRYSIEDSAYPVPIFSTTEAAQTVWAFHGGSGISGNGSAFTSGNPNAPEGSQVAFLQGNGSFSQDIAGFTAGAYTFSFDAAQRANFGTSIQDFQVSLDGTTIGAFLPTSTAYLSLTTAPVVVASGTHTLTFTGLDTVGGDNTAFVDNIRVSSAPVPEASTTVSLGLMLALGLGGVVVAAKRKKAGAQA